MLLRQLRSPLNYILIVAAAVTLWLGEHIDAGVIAFVLVLNTAIGFVQERRAEGAVRALMKLVVPQARVLRDGHEQQIDSRGLVSGVGPAGAGRACPPICAWPGSAPCRWTSPC